MHNGIIDAHSHLADLRLSADLISILDEANGLGIKTHIQAGVGPEDWERQRSLAKLFPKSGIVPVFGLHPYWVSEHSREECELALDQLAQQVEDCPALGETGLDFRDRILLRNDQEEAQAKAQQIDFFEAQLELARFVDKPVILHLVKAFHEAQVIIKFHPNLRGFVHSFNGNLSEAQFYLKQGLLISVGGPIARNTNQRLKEVIRQIPLESLLLETDSPDQSPDALRGKLNRPGSLLTVAEVVADLHSKTVSEVLDRCSENCRKLLRL